MALAKVVTADQAVPDKRAATAEQMQEAKEGMFVRRIVAALSPQLIGARRMPALSRRTRSVPLGRRSGAPVRRSGSKAQVQPPR